LQDDRWRFLLPLGRRYRSDRRPGNFKRQFPCFIALNFNNRNPIRDGELSGGRIVARQRYNGIYVNKAKARVNLDGSQAWIYWHSDGRTRH
jgi:hypothetical protein